MYAIVKFKNNPFPTIMQIENVSYTWDLSTMSRVEWVVAGTISWDGKFSARKERTTDTMLGDVSVTPYRPGDPDPLEKFRAIQDADAKARATEGKLTGISGLEHFTPGRSPGIL